MTVADILAMGLNAKPKTRTVDVCLNGELDDQLTKLNRRLMESQDSDATSLGANSAAKIRDEIVALQEKARAEALTFKIRRLDWNRNLELQTEHPPRDGNSEDAEAGWNRATYYPALVRECTYEVEAADGTTLDAESLTADWWDAIFAAVNFRQFDELFTAAHAVNSTDAAAPFLRADLQISPSNDGDSRQPEPGESAPSGSQGGSRRKPRSTSTTKKAASPDQ